jgi:SAM-dependent methyltransferase
VTGSVRFDRVAGTYDDTRGGMERGRRTAEILDGLLPPGPLLEVGVGTGLVAAALTERGRTPVGVDLSQPMLERARARLGSRVAVGDALRLPVRTGAVAGVCLVHVLHLVAEIPGTLAEVARVLRPGGTLVATAFPRNVVEGDLSSELTRLQHRFGVQDRPDDPDVVLRQAEAAGFAAAFRRDEPGYPTTPRGAADRIESRSPAWTWSIDDDVWERDMPAAIARLRALPDQDRVRPGRGPSILAFHKS